MSKRPFLTGERNREPSEPEKQAHKDAVLLVLSRLISCPRMTDD